MDFAKKSIGLARQIAARESRDKLLEMPAGFNSRLLYRAKSGHLFNPSQ
jgi:hypothetical protein